MISSYSYGAEGKKYNGLARGDPYAVPFVVPIAGGAGAAAAAAGGRSASSPAAGPRARGVVASAASAPISSAGGASANSKSEEPPVIGAGINWYTREIFFTRNGQPLGAAFTAVPTVKLYPTISMHSPNEAIRSNFGQRKFRFDIDSYRAVRVTASVLCH